MAKTKPRKLIWTDKQRDILELVKQGKTDREIFLLGHSMATISRVRSSYRRGEVPEKVPTEPPPVTPLLTTPPNETQPLTPGAAAPEKPPEEKKATVPPPEHTSKKEPQAKKESPKKPPLTAAQKQVVKGIQLGAIMVMPEDWRLTQHDVYLILNTYYLTQAEINYGGTVGEFLGMMCRIYRRAMMYPEMPLAEPEIIPEEGDDDGRGTEKSNGDGGGAESLAGDIAETVGAGVTAAS